jgi:hypothetical protein
VTPNYTAGHSAELLSSASVAALGGAQFVGSASLNAQFTQFADSAVIHVDQYVFDIHQEYRTYTIPSESRTFGIHQESRTALVSSEDRVTDLHEETRLTTVEG